MRGWQVPWVVTGDSFEITPAAAGVWGAQVCSAAELSPEQGTASRRKEVHLAICPQAWSEGQGTRLQSPCQLCKRKAWAQ